jgi:hypothetical protein
MIVIETGYRKSDEAGFPAGFSAKNPKHKHEINKETSIYESFLFQNLSKNILLSSKNHP